MSDDYYEMQWREREAKLQRLQQDVIELHFASLSKESVRNVAKTMIEVIYEKYPDNDLTCKIWDRHGFYECCECIKMWKWSKFDQFVVICVMTNRRNDLQRFLDETLVDWKNILKVGELLQQPWVVDMAFETIMDLDDATVSCGCEYIPAMEAIPTLASTASDGVYAVLVKHGLTPIDPRRLYRGALKLMV